MNRAKSNKVRAVVLAVLVIVIAGWIALDRPVNRLDTNRNAFAYADPSQIDRVLLTINDQEVELSFNGVDWMLNNTYQADPQRIQLLFAILKQMQVRRSVANVRADSVNELMETNGAEVRFFEGPNEVHNLEIVGEEAESLSYVRADGTNYIIEIPGYRSYLAGIFLLDESGWRNPLVFDLNWRNLVKVVRYESDGAEAFSISQRNNYYQIDALPATDSLKLFNYLDDLSLLYVNDYLDAEEVDTSAYDVDYTMVVSDVARQNHSMEVFKKQAEEDIRLIRIDSVDFAEISDNLLKAIDRKTAYFEPSE